ncbi:glycosyl transferase family 21-domain-containing protein [Fimicolochytrium jonesii]|uniref:glycosyl transferase family 21-domain-containing protein n=1 Tax=Fimicolochytrium jonesii TaxID=1396493 RepID=UPI0022FEE854|nr:glycosyl transferase family 21-domain-containing protein [Fimicolochytrium jonesii]KAI8822451.1 glycosyl transferase family 21-domain-containing protein [Fimicolochytrium jonesii]
MASSTPAAFFGLGSEQLKNWLAVLCLAMWALLMFFCATGTVLIRSRHAKKSSSTTSSPSSPSEHSPLAPIPTPTPGVTIIRPLKGIDVNLAENLSSSFRQTYPHFEILFTVADPKDPAVAVVHDLIKTYPNVDARLLTDPIEVGVNPKINNMIRAYQTAKYDIIWIIDSNVSVPPGCLSRSVVEISRPGIGLVHHLPCGVSPQTFGSRLEQAFLNTAHAKMYATINKLSVASCIIGKSNMFRKSSLAHLGGLEYFGKFMSEDNIIGEAIWATGKRHAMTTDLASQSLGSLSVADYLGRRARWIRIRKYVTTAATLVEPFTESIVNGLLGSWGAYRLFAVPPHLFLPLHFALWILSDVLISTTLDCSVLRDPVKFIAAWCVREVLALPLWCYAMAGRTVAWRGKWYWLRSDGTVTVAGGWGGGFGEWVGRLVGR